MEREKLSVRLSADMARKVRQRVELSPYPLLFRFIERTKVPENNARAGSRTMPREIMRHPDSTVVRSLGGPRLPPPA